MKLYHNIFLLLVLTSCHHPLNFPKGSFGYDEQFIRAHDTSLIELSKGDAKIIVSAKYQGKVFTSTASGDTGYSFGWVNYPAFDAPFNPHINAYGGENRFWIGPEGSQFSFFFKKGDPMDLDNWHTPPAFDSEPWQLVSKNDTSAVLRKEMQLRNYAGSDFKLRVDRSIVLLKQAQIDSLLKITLPVVIKAVGYRTENTITNIGDYAWTEQTGAPCNWLLDMLPASDKTTVVAPYLPGEGKAATTDYYGEVPSDRIYDNGKAVFFRADANRRTKFGIHSSRMGHVAGSYDAGHQILTIILFDIDPHAKYLNEVWRRDLPPFVGDDMISYNDGRPTNGKQLGKFYELESASPALFLSPGGSGTHEHTVFHFTGSESELDKVAEKVLGVDIQTIINDLRNK